MERSKLSNSESQRMIKEAMRKIVLGRSFERIELTPTGTSGIGTARLTHGYVAKIHSDPSDPEYSEYAGTIDVGEFPDETASSEPVIHKGVLLSGIQDNSGGFLIIPTLFSDVTIVSDAATKYMYVVNFSHADIIQLQSHTETKVGVCETDELDTEDNDSPDYDELEKTGNEAFTYYTKNRIEASVKNDKGKEAIHTIEPEGISHIVEKSEINQTANKIEQKIGSNGLFVINSKVSLGDENAVEPVVLGQQLAQLMLEFLTECSKITTPTLMGTMPAINFPNFASLISKIQNFLSQTVYTK